MRATAASCGVAFAALVVRGLMSAVIVHLPPRIFWRTRQPAVEEIFRQHAAASSAPRSWRSGALVRQQLRAGEDEALELGPLAVDTHRRSTLCGELVDSGLSIPSRRGLWPSGELSLVTTTQYVLNRRGK